MIPALAAGSARPLIMLIDTDRQWHLSRRGEDAISQQTRHCEAFCAHAIRLPEPVMPGGARGCG